MAAGGAAAAAADDASSTHALVPRAPPAGPPSAASAAPLPTAEPLGFCAALFLALAAALPLAAAAGSARPAATAAAGYCALAPPAALFAAVAARLPDAAVSRPFLLRTAFIAAGPALLAVLVVEIPVAALGMFAVFGGTLAPLAQEYADGVADATAAVGAGASTAPADLSSAQKEALRAGIQRVWDRVRAEIPLWRAVAAVVLMAFVVAAGTEELAKYLVARRAHALRPAGIRARGVVSVAAAAALGLAGSEHVMYAMNFSAQFDSLPRALAEGALRAAFAFPMHVGTTFWVGTRMARYAVLRDRRVGFAKSLAVPVLFHGALDAFAFLAMAEEATLPLLTYLTYPFNLVIIVVLLTMCRNEFYDLVACEDAVLSAEEADRNSHFSALPDDDGDV